jgi:hypothetical protein
MPRLLFAWTYPGRSLRGDLPRERGRPLTSPEPPLQILRRLQVCHPESWGRLLRNDSRMQPSVQEVPKG